MRTPALSAMCGGARAEGEVSGPQAASGPRSAIGAASAGTRRGRVGKVVPTYLPTTRFTTTLVSPTSSLSTNASSPPGPNALGMAVSLG